MTLWTIQSLEAWQVLKTSGRLRCNRRFAETEFLPAYQWMMGQMAKRLRPRPSNQSLPLWGWYQYESAVKKRPDLRSSGHVPKGQRAVLLEIELHESEVLLSDFDLWHYVLNYWHLPSSVAEGDAFESELAKYDLSYFNSKPLPHKGYHAKIVRSWERIFDIDWEAEEIAASKAEKSIQATFWALHLRDVRSAKEFVGR